MESIKYMVSQICNTLFAPDESPQFKAGLTAMATDIITQLGLQNNFDQFAARQNSGLVPVNQEVSIVDLYKDKCSKNSTIKGLAFDAMQTNRRAFFGYSIRFVAHRVAEEITIQVNAKYRSL